MYGIVTMIWIVTVAGLLVYISSRAGVSQKQKFWFPVPMCDPNGRCGEDPKNPSPPSRYSLRSASQEASWDQRHEHNRKMAGEYFQKPKLAPVVLLGDSIFESLTGTSYDEPIDRAVGVPAIFQKFYGDSLVLAISGDQTQHLLWRMPRELPDAARAENVTFVVLIGTNNIGSGFLPHDTAAGILAVVDWLLTETRGNVLLLALLPRGDSARLANLCPPRCRAPNLPYRSFMPAIDRVHEIILTKLHHNITSPRLTYVHHCGDLVFRRSNASSVAADTVDDDEVRRDRMPDLLHPNAHGHALLAHCLLPELHKLQQER